MTNPTLHPGFYKINRFEIVRQGSEGNLDISSLVPELIIDESMDANCIRGRASIVDKTSLLESLPIRGEERLIVEVEDVEGISHAYDFFLFKVSDVLPTDSNDGLTYVIHFCSFSRYVAGLSRICKSYDSYIHDIVGDIFKDYFVPEANGFEPVLPKYGQLSEPSATDSIQHLIIPNMTPMQAMEFLSNRAYSTVHGSSSFRFFENTEGYHFINDEDAYFRSPESINFMFSDAVVKDGSSFLEQRHNLLEMGNPARVNTIDDINSGAYRNEVIEIDIVKKEVTSKTFDATDPSKRLMGANPLDSIDYHSEPFTRQTFTDQNARRFMVVKTNVADMPGSLSPNDHMSDLISGKVSYRYHLDKIRINAASHGRMNLTCGQTVEINVLKYSPANGKLEPNEQLSGDYMVRSVSRQFIRDTYRNVMVLSKVTWNGTIEV